MGEWIDLKASDGFALKAWPRAPAGALKGGIVVIQEIFGVNAHIRSVADRFAAAGYLAIAPAIFDRVERNVELGYDGPGIASGSAIAGKLDAAASLFDVSAAQAAAAAGGKVGIVGFCLGGSYAWVASAKLPGFAAAVGYYGGRIAAAKSLQPKVPTILHFGENDDHIPMAAVREIEALHPDVPVYVYPAGHGFNCDARGSYDKPSADLAWQRTMALFDKHLA